VEGIRDRCKGLRNFVPKPSELQYQLEKEVTEKKIIEDKLKESERELRNIINNSRDTIFKIDLKGNYTLANKAAEELTGYSVDELLRMNMRELIAPEYQHYVFNRLKRRIAGESLEQPFDFEIIHKNGYRVAVELTTAPVYDEDGNLIGVQGIARDITERKRVEEALYRRDAILEAVSFAAQLFLQNTWEESIQEVIKRLGQATGVSRVYIFENHVAADGTLLTSQRYEWVMPGITPQIDNPELQNFPWVAGGFGRWVKILSRGEVVCGHVREFPESEQEVLSAQDIKSILIVPIFVNQDWWGFIGFDECLKEREWSMAEINALKTAAGILGSAIQRDLVDRKLKESEEKYRTTFERTGTAMIVVEEDTTISMVNSEFERLTGYRKEEVEGKMSWTQFVHPEDLGWMKEYHYGRRMKKSIPKKYEFRATDKYGNVKNLFITIDLLPDGKRSVASIVDITCIKKLNKLLKATSEINELVVRDNNPETILKAVCQKLNLVYDAVFTLIRDGSELRYISSVGMKGELVETAINQCPAISKALMGEIGELKASSEDCRRCLSPKFSYVLSIPLNYGIQYGIITIYSNSEYTKDEKELLKKLSRNIAFAINAYNIEKDRRLAIEQLVSNLEQFDRSADRLRNPLAVIVSSLELVDELGENKTLKIIGDQVNRIKKELDELRKEEIKTYNLIRNRSNLFQQVS